MAAITDYTAYKLGLQSSTRKVSFTINALSTVAGRLYDTYVTGGLPANTAPTTAVVPGMNKQMTFSNAGSSTLDLLSGQFSATDTGVIIICDRLSHQGGLDGTSTASQNTNLPTASLTRYTSGEGVMAGITIYSQVGTTSTDVRFTYTNQAGTSGQVSPRVLFGATGFREAGRLILCPLLAGDTGVRAVQNITLAASTGTVGNFGVTIFKPLFAMIISAQMQTVYCNLTTGYCSGNIPEVQDDACLFAITCTRTTSFSGTGNLLLEEF